MGNLAFVLRAGWLLIVCLQLIVLATMTVRKLFRDLPTLYFYIFLNLCETPLFYATYACFGFRSWPAFYVTWITQAVVVLARWLVVCQLCYLALARFRGIWGLAWRLLLACGGVVMVVAAKVGGHDVPRLVTTFDLALELSIATVLAVFFAFARYYKVSVLPSLRSMGIALCLYSCFRALNDVILQKFLYEYANAWSLFDEVTYVATLALIISAVFLLRRIPAQNIRLLPAGAYAAFMPEANDRLSALNTRLAQLLRTKEPERR